MRANILVLVFDPLQPPMKLPESSPSSLPLFWGDPCFPEPQMHSLGRNRASRPWKVVGSPWMEEDASRTCPGLGTPAFLVDLPRGCWFGYKAQLPTSATYMEGGAGNKPSGMRHPAAGSRAAVPARGRTAGSHSLWPFFSEALCPLPAAFLRLSSLSWPLAVHLCLPLQAPRKGPWPHISNLPIQAPVLADSVSPSTPGF